MVTRNITTKRQMLSVVALSPASTGVWSSSDQQVIWFALITSSSPVPVCKLTLNSLSNENLSIECLELIIIIL